MVTRTHLVPNGDGWQLALKQVFDPARLVKGRRPVAIIPGYGMNAFIFGYHPTGLSMEAYLASKGFEVWSVNLRNQGGSKRVGGSRNYTIGDIALTDVPAALRAIVAKSETGARAVDGIGCSLGGTYLFAYAALAPAEELGSIVSMGGPLRWVEIHPVLKMAFRSPRLLGAIPFGGTRSLARVLLPILVKRTPFLLKIYMHPEIVDTSKADRLIQTVEDPNRFLNREIAEWVLSKDLVIDGRSVTEGLGRVKKPLLCMVANADGICPEPTITSAIDAIGGEVKDVIRCGNEKVRMAHADMFVSDYSQEMVFEPLCAWLARQNDRREGKKPERKEKKKGRGR